MKKDNKKDKKAKCWKERNSQERREWMIQLLKFLGLVAMFIATAMFFSYYIDKTENVSSPLIIAAVGLLVGYIKAFIYFLRDVRFLVIAFIVLICIPAVIYFFVELHDLVHLRQ